jgi:pyruvate/2-oxoglutarate dehydrogenase complex dihydrolipoamide dehydrogenase (E3) component
MPDCYERDQVMTTHFDAMIIGAGQAGPSLAGRLTAAGMRVAVIERKFFGGTCVNTGCTPTKTLVASAATAHLARRAGEYGVSVGGAVSIDMHAVKARMDAISHKSRDGVESWLRGMERCTVIQGHARFGNCSSPHPGGAVKDDLPAHRLAERKVLDTIMVESIPIAACRSFPTSTT